MLFLVEKYIRLRALDTWEACPIGTSMCLALASSSAVNWLWSPYPCLNKAGSTICFHLSAIWICPSSSNIKHFSMVLANLSFNFFNLNIVFEDSNSFSRNNIEIFHEIFFTQIEPNSYFWPDKLAIFPWSILLFQIFSHIGRSVENFVWSLSVGIDSFFGKKNRILALLCTLIREVKIFWKTFLRAETGKELSLSSSLSLQHAFSMGKYLCCYFCYMSLMSLHNYYIGRCKSQAN